MYKRMIMAFHASITAVALAGCGGDGIDVASSETTAATSGGSSTATAETTTTEGTPTTGETPTTGGTPTTGEMLTTGDESTTGEPAGCPVPGDGADADADGVANRVDNCRCDANPNQLDFDGDAMGNVCDRPLKFTTADGAPPELNLLATTAHAEKSLDCDFGVNLVVLDSTIEVALDDAGNAKIFASRVNYADTPELSCDLGGGLIVKLKVQQFFAEGLDPFTVGFPFTLPDHKAGTLAGMTDAPHSILASAIINVTESPNELFLAKGEDALTAVPGVFPTAAVTVIGNGQQISLEFADQDTVLFEQTTEAGVKFRLTGLTGTLRLKQ